MIRLRWVLLVVLNLLLTTAVHAQDTWDIHAEAIVSETNIPVLEETFLPPKGGQPSVKASEGLVRWTWWSHSEETGSLWPDDDALYRANHLNLTPPGTGKDPIVKQHVLWSEETVRIEGSIRTVSAEDQTQFVLFELDITPLSNLSNQTLLYVALTENIAQDQHHRETNHLVRELRPEVGFSLTANNTTRMNAMLPADHLLAAGVDLGEEPTGWSYTLAMFGGTEDNASEIGLLALRHGALPTPLNVLTPGERWIPVLVMALAAVVIVSILSAARSRERAIPSLKGSWSNTNEDEVLLTVTGGSHAFDITGWNVGEPWAFKGRPAKRSFDLHQETTIPLKFKAPHQEDCHLYVSISIEEMGAWRQHVWLSRTQPELNADFPSMEEE